MSDMKEAASKYARFVKSSNWVDDYTVSYLYVSFIIKIQGMDEKRKRMD